MNKTTNFIKKILVDILGVLCIIAAILLGWLPGPGGIPLLIGGLGLLATNHEWARRLLRYVEVNGVKILHKIFPENKLVQNIYDCAALILAITGIVIIVSAEQRWQQSAGVSMIFVSLGIGFVNRDRWKKLATLFKS